MSNNNLRVKESIYFNWIHVTYTYTAYLQERECDFYFVVTHYGLMALFLCVYYITLRSIHKIS